MTLTPRVSTHLPYSIAATIGVLSNIVILDALTGLTTVYFLWLSATVTVLPVYLYRVYTGPIDAIHTEQQAAVLAIMLNIILLVTGILQLFHQIAIDARLSGIDLQ